MEVGVAGHGHDRRSNNDNTAYIRSLPGFSSSFSPAVSRTYKPLRKPAPLSSGLCACFGASGIENAYTTVSMRMSILIGIGTTSSFSCCACHSHPGCYSSLPRTSTTHNGARLKQRTTTLLHSPGDRGALPQRPRTHPLFTAPHPVEERHQARNGRVGDD